MRPGHGIARRVSALRRAVKGRTAGVWHAEQPRDLVKALPCRVVARTAENAQLRIVLDIDEHGVPAGDDKAQKRRLQVRVGQIVGRDMALDVVDRNERHIERQCSRLGKIHADEQRADKAGRIGHGDGVQLAARQAGVLQRLLGKTVDGLNMLARGDLRHNAAVFAVQRHLRGDAVRQDASSVLHNGDGGLVAGGLNGKDPHDRAPF